MSEKEKHAAPEPESPEKLEANKLKESERAALPGRYRDLLRWSREMADSSREDVRRLREVIETAAKEGH